MTDPTGTEPQTGRPEVPDLLAALSASIDRAKAARTTSTRVTHTTPVSDAGLCGNAANGLSITECQKRPEGCPCFPASGAGLDLDAVEPEPPNAVEVDESGCSCKIGPYRGFQRCPIDPACPKHGEPLRHGDGDVRVFHPDGSTSIIREPSEAEHLESLARAVASVTPCSCSAQRARAEVAEAEVVTLRAQVKGLHEELLRGDPDVVTLRARLAAVEALADQWADRQRSDGMSGNAWIGLTLSGVAADLRAALATTGEGERPKCDTCNDTGRCDWSPGEHRDTEEWDRPCIDHCDATTGEGE